MAKVGEEARAVDDVVGCGYWLTVSCHAYCDAWGRFGDVFDVESFGVESFGVEGFGVESCLSESIGGGSHGCFRYSSELGGCCQRRKVDGSVGQVTRPCLFPLRFLQQVTSLVRVDCRMILYFCCKSEFPIRPLFHILLMPVKHSGEMAMVLSFEHQSPKPEGCTIPSLRSV